MLSNKKNKALIALNGKRVKNSQKYNKLYDRNKYLFIAADGGAKFLQKINFIPDIIIGDMDSLSEQELSKYKNYNIKIKKFPVEKNETDGELAINYCVKKGIKQIYIIGSQGGRFDQQLANIFLLEYAYKKGLEAFIKEPGLEAGIIHNHKIFKRKTNMRLSLLPLSEEVSKVNITGCKYNTSDIILYRHKTRGISNKILKNKAEVSIEQGLLLYIINN